MDSSIVSLFEYTRSRVCDQDIIDFSPGDPGYPDYVKVWTEIRRSGAMPTQADFDLSEVIGLTGWAKPDEWPDPERFRRYRRFTSAIGLALLHHGQCSEVVRPANYLARDLLIDLDPSCERHLSLVRSAVEATRKLLSTTNLDEGYPFFTLATMILAQKASDWKASEAAATRLIADEAAVRKSDSLSYLAHDDQFLFGLSVYNQVHSDWLAMACVLKNPNRHEDSQLVIESLTDH